MAALRRRRLRLRRHRRRDRAANAGGSTPATSPATAVVTNPPFLDSTVTDPGCGGCQATIDVAGTLTARIQGGADTVDTAYGSKDFGGASGLAGRVYVRTLVGLAAGQTLNQNLAVFQVLDTGSRLVFELYLTSSRVPCLWSPAGGLRSTSLNQCTAVAVPNTGTGSVRVEVSALANTSLIVRIDDLDRITVTGLGGATTSNQRFLAPASSTTTRRRRARPSQ